MDDGKIIELYFKRDQQAIKETSEKYGKALTAVSLHITENDQDAEECVNDTYLQAWNRIPPDCPQYLYAFLAKITRNISINMCDKRNAQKRKAVTVELSEELEQCVGTPCEELDLDKAALSKCIDDFVKGLDEDTQYIFVHRYFFSESVKTIAKHTGRIEPSVSSVLYRTRKKLKKTLEKEGFTL